ncbi:MAG: hypothetical protein E6K18_00025 [Methanobacteriota archaeon]|nr:MAG: hypothetical protein E6K18_00025 [Euryarchaeota archaeon]
MSLDPAAVIRGFGAGLAAAAAMMGIQALAWTRWGHRAVFEWTEAEAGTVRLLGHKSFRAALVLNLLAGGVAGIVFALGLALLAATPTAVLGAAFGSLMWVITLIIHEPVTGDPARGAGVPISLVSHLAYGALLGAFA